MTPTRGRTDPIHRSDLPLGAAEAATVDAPSGVPVDLAGDVPVAVPAEVEPADGRSVLLRGSSALGVRVGDFVRVRTGSRSFVVFVDEVSRDDSDVTAVGRLVLPEEAPPPAGSSSATLEPAASGDVSGAVGDDDERLHLGHLWDRPDVPVGLRGRRLNRHTFWCGQSGSGKTYALGVALERIIAATRLPVVVLDPNSDFTRIDTVRPGAAAADLPLAQRDIRVLRPDDPENPLRVRFTELTPQGQAAVLRLDPISHRAEYNALLRLSEELTGQDTTSILPHLRSRGDPDAEALAQRLENLGVIHWHDTWAQGAVAATDVVDQRPDVTVLDIGGLDRHEQQLTVALAVLEDLWRHRGRRRPVLLVVDEAHNLCPPVPDTPLGAAVLERVIQIAAEGRKFGIWLLVSTQRPGKVHPGIVSQCDNVAILRMNSRADLDELAQTFGFVPPEMLRRTTQFAQGQALLAGGFVSYPSIIRVRPRVTLEGGIDVPVPMEAR